MYTVEAYNSLCPNGLRLGGSLYNSIANLIEGLAYLRELRAAHLDLKPGNIVYTDNVRLHVINFGTVVWIAPEIQEQGAFSSIRADRWSYGKILPCFLKKSDTEDGDL
ncbi:hypothetical protein F5888DRAFT_1801971 [Russula emetica]|nr:hypothetical protein F5888DRAFT_1801971 [Russula emetica]